MWLNKFLSLMKNAFVGPSGLRSPWRVIIALICYYLWTYLSAAVLTWFFAILFDAWGVNSLNLHLAPGWVRAVVNGYPYVVSIVANLPVAIIMTALVRKKRPLRPKNAVFFPFGILAAAVPCALFVLTDSLRTAAWRPFLHWAIIANLPVCIAAAWSEQALSRDLIPSFIPGRKKRAISYVLSAAIVLLITRAWEAGITGAINLALMSVALMRLTETHGSWPAIFLRAGWMWATSSLLGMSGTEISLYSFYPVSERIITGGEGGLICGLFTTAILIAAILIIFRKELPKPKKKTPAA